MVKRNWLINMRINAGLNQTQAAALADMTQQHLSKLETTSMIPSIIDAYALSRVYYVSVDEIYNQIKNEYERKQKRTKSSSVPHEKREWLQELRKSKRLTQADLAKMTGLSTSTIHYIEDGKKCSKETAHKIAAVLGIDENKFWE